MRSIVIIKPIKNGFFLTIRDELAPDIIYICSSLNNIHVHHKDENVKNNTLENLITLCAFCHLKVHGRMKIDKDKLNEVWKLRKENWSYAKIGKKFGVSRQRIHQLLKNYPQ